MKMYLECFEGFSQKKKTLWHVYKVLTLGTRRRRFLVSFPALLGRLPRFVPRVPSPILRSIAFS